MFGTDCRKEIIGSPSLFLLFEKFLLTSFLVSDILCVTRKLVTLQSNFVRIMMGDPRRDPMPLKNYLKEYRAHINVNQQELGQMVGTSRQTVSQIERGDYSPSVTLALKIAKVCGATVEDIFEYVEDENDERE